MAKTAACAECKRTMRIAARGLCSACYYYSIRPQKHDRRRRRVCQSSGPGPAFPPPPGYKERTRFPMSGDRYFFVDAIGRVDSSHWTGHEYDHRLLQFGNCFLTEQGARAAREKIKEVLLAGKERS